ncbi:hypothetical protein Pelo_13550 [Pelomyxa schiedti]|nr:hypothetical protein Pelo_13550 [Pelomyxa schiedti]
MHNVLCYNETGSDQSCNQCGKAVKSGAPHVRQEWYNKRDAAPKYFHLRCCNRSPSTPQFSDVRDLVAWPLMRRAEVDFVLEKVLNRTVVLTSEEKSRRLANDKLWRFKEMVREVLPAIALRELLTSNNIPLPSSLPVHFMVHMVADGMMNGLIDRCPTCGHHSLVFDGVESWCLDSAYGRSASGVRQAYTCSSSKSEGVSRGLWNFSDYARKKWLQIGKLQQFVEREAAREAASNTEAREREAKAQEAARLAAQAEERRKEEARKRLATTTTKIESVSNLDRKKKKVKENSLAPEAYLDEEVGEAEMRAWEAEDAEFSVPQGHEFSGMYAIFIGDVSRTIQVNFEAFGGCVVTGIADATLAITEKKAFHALPSAFTTALLVAARNRKLPVFYPDFLGFLVKGQPELRQRCNALSFLARPCSMPRPLFKPCLGVVDTVADQVPTQLYNDPTATLTQLLEEGYIDMEEYQRRIRNLESGINIVDPGENDTKHSGRVDYLPLPPEEPVRPLTPKPPQPRRTFRTVSVGDDAPSVVFSDPFSGTIDENVHTLSVLSLSQTSAIKRIRRRQNAKRMDTLERGVWKGTYDHWGRQLPVVFRITYVGRGEWYYCSAPSITQDTICICGHSMPAAKTYPAPFILPSPSPFGGRVVVEQDFAPAISEMPEGWHPPVSPSNYSLLQGERDLFVDVSITRFCNCMNPTPGCTCGRGCGTACDDESRQFAHAMTASGVISSDRLVLAEYKDVYQQHKWDPTYEEPEGENTEEKWEAKVNKPVRFWEGFVNREAGTIHGTWWQYVDDAAGALAESEAPSPAHWSIREGRVVFTGEFSVALQGKGNTDPTTAASTEPVPDTPTTEEDEGDVDDDAQWVINRNLDPAERRKTKAEKMQEEQQQLLSTVATVAATEADAIKPKKSVLKAKKKKKADTTKQPRKIIEPLTDPVHLSIMERLAHGEVVRVGGGCGAMGPPSNW